MSHQEQNTPATPAPGEPYFAALPDAGELQKSGWVWRLIDVLLAIAIVGMLVVLLIQVIARLIGASPTWTEEAARFLFMDGVFLGLAAGFRIGAHPRVSFLVAKGPKWLGELSLHLTVASALFFFGVLAWKSVELIMQQIGTNETSPALGLSMWIITVPLALGACLSIVASIQSIYFDKGLRQRMLDGEVIA
jgi:TRAP-type C4-dicarboxylate transport system permease small subunit